MPMISFAIFGLNDAQSLDTLRRGPARDLDSITRDFQLKLLENCGKNNSWPVFFANCAHDANLKGVRLSRFFGQHGALLRGIVKAHYEFIDTPDDNLQKSLSNTARLLRQLYGIVDVIDGNPRIGQFGVSGNFASMLTKTSLQKRIEAEIARTARVFRAFNMGLRMRFSHCPRPFVSINVLLTSLICPHLR